MYDIRSQTRSWAAIVAGFVAVTLGGFHSTAWSEDIAPPAVAEVKSGQPQTLEQRINILERKLEISAEDEASKAKERVSAKASPADGFSLKSADNNFSIKFRALLQADGRFFFNDKAGNQTNTFLLRRVRPSIEANFYRDYDLVIVPDFANQASTVLFDAYLEAKPWSFAKLRVGKFKPPVGLEHLQSDANTSFPERGYPSLLAPGRDTGVQLSGEFSTGAYGYALSATNGLGDNNSTGETDTNDGKEGSARLWTKPFKNTETALLQGLHLGFGGSYAGQNVAAPTYRTTGQVALFTPAATATPDGLKVRLAPEFAWYYHSFVLGSEWAQSSQVYKVGTRRSRVNNQAWQAALGYVLTGEDATYTGVKPRKPFDPQTGGWGAFQLVSRYQVFYLDPNNFDRGVTTTATSVQRATELAGGVNWYLNTIVRISSIYANTEFDKGATSGDRPNEKLFLTRFQVNF